MPEINWGQYAEAFKAIYDKIAEVFGRLHDVVLQRRGTPYEINVSASGEIGPNVATGKKLVIYGFNFTVDSGMKARLRYGSAGRIIATCRGTNGMNLINVKEEGPTEIKAYIEIVNGIGTVEGTLYAEVVNT